MIAYCIDDKEDRSNKQPYQSNIIEQRFTDIAAKDNEYFNIEVKPYEILTVGVERKEA